MKTLIDILALICSVLLLFVGIVVAGSVKTADDWNKIYKERGRDDE